MILRWVEWPLDFVVNLRECLDETAFNFQYYPNFYSQICCMDDDNKAI